MKYSFIIVAALFIFSCSKSIPAPGVATCMQAQIDSAMAKPKGSLFFQIDSYQYEGKLVYLYFAGCCDRYNDVKDGNCNYLFSPSGGFGSGGDGSHPNFFNEAVLIETVWKDPRP